MLQPVPAHVVQAHAEALVLAVSGPIAALLAVAALLGVWLLAVSLGWVLAPVSDPLHAMWMRPEFRRLVALGSFSRLLARSRAMRQQLLRRYLRALAHDDERSEWLRRYVAPRPEAHGERVARQLAHDRRMLVAGEPGVGKSALLAHLAAAFAEPSPSFRGIRRIPILLDVAGPGAKRDVDALAREALERLGQISDPGLAHSLLGAGGFVYLVDGADDVDVDVLRGLEAWARCLPPDDWVCMAVGDDPSEGFDGWSRLIVEPLDREALVAVLGLEVGAERAALLLERMSDATLELARNPHDLRLVVDLMRPGAEPPASRAELYERTFAPTIDRWLDAGRAELARTLFATAWSLEAEHGSLLVELPSPQPMEIRDHLWQRKLLVRRGQTYHLRHRLLRAYLAAQHLAGHWPDVLMRAGAAMPTISDVVLRFAVIALEGPDEAERFCFALFDRSPAQAVRLVDWLASHGPLHCGDWLPVFRRTHAAATLGGLLEDLRRETLHPLGPVGRAGRVPVAA